MFQLFFLFLFRFHSPAPRQLAKSKKWLVLVVSTVLLWEWEKKNQQTKKISIRIQIRSIWMLLCSPFLLYASLVGFSVNFNFLLEFALMYLKFRDQFIAWKWNYFFFISLRFGICSDARGKAFRNRHRFGWKCSSRFSSNSFQAICHIFNLAPPGFNTEEDDIFFFEYERFPKLNDSTWHSCIRYVVDDGTFGDLDWLIWPPQSLCLFVKPIYNQSPGNLTMKRSQFFR